MQDIYTRASEWLHAHTEEMVQELQAFARIRSVSRADLGCEGAPYGPECRAMLDFALKRAQEMGFETEDHDGHCGSAILGNGLNAIGIIGHLDVVPEGEQWLYPPYGATRVGDFLIGRGVSDNKPAVVMGLFLMRMFRELQIPLLHGIRVLMGCSEETGMHDMQYYADHFAHPVISLIPDSNFPANYAQKGSLRGNVRIDLGEQIAEFIGGEVFNMVPPKATALVRCTVPPLGEGFDVALENGMTRITAHGVAAHAARPEGGKSAIHMLSTALLNADVLSGQSRSAMEAVQTLSGDIYGAHAMIACEDPDTGRSTMVVGLAHTEDGTVSLSVDCRLSIVTDVERDSALLQNHARDLGFEPYDFATTKPVYMPKDDPRIEAVQSAYYAVTGDPAEPFSSGGGTYARVLDNAITFGIIFPGDQPRPEGLPASHGSAHAPDEYQHIPSLIRAAEIYTRAILALDSAILKEDT